MLHRRDLEPRMRGKIMKTKLWLGVGSAVLAGSVLNTIIPTTDFAVALFGVPSAYAQDSGESGESGAVAPAAAAGGEGGEGGGEGGGAAPASYLIFID
jgi:hypothetical protein